MLKQNLGNIYMSFIDSHYQNLNHDYLSEIYLTFPNNLLGNQNYLIMKC